MVIHARILIVLVCAISIFSIGGFYSTYFRYFPGFENVSWEVHFHLATLACWMIMLVSQAILARKGQFQWHRRVGKLSYVWVPLIIVGFVLVTDYGQQRQKSPDLVGATLFDGMMFILFYGMAMLNRKHADSHASYMILTAIPLINPSLGRFISPEVSISFEFLVLVALLMQARWRKKPTRPFLFGIASFILLLGVIVLTSVMYPAIMEAFWQSIWGS